LNDSDILDDDLIRWYDEWEAGRTKVDIERVSMSDVRSHGKRITKLWRCRLGIETETPQVCPRCGEALRPEREACEA